MMRLLARLSVVVAIFLVTASLVSPVVSQSKSVEVPRRDADITILPNGDVHVVETWDVKFNGGPFTSAYRSMPLNKVDNIDGWSVADEEHQYRQVGKGSSKEPYTFEYTSGDGKMKATWFYPAATDQARTFKVGYMLHGALRIDPAGDEFYWKFVESDRQYPINASRVVLHLPEGFEAGQLKAMAYRNGAERAGARVVDDRTMEFTDGPFPGSTEWEIRAQFPHGAVKAVPPAWQVAVGQKSPVQQSKDQGIAARLQDEVRVRNLAFVVAAVACVGAIVWAWQPQRRKVRFTLWAAILFIFGAVFFIAISVMFGTFLGGVVCMVMSVPVFVPLLAVSASRRRNSRDAGSQPRTRQSGDQLSGDHDFGSSSWNSGSLDLGSSDWSSASRDFGGSSDGGSGGTSGFN